MPSGWINTCYKSTAAVGSLLECFDACSPGLPACLSSPEETRFIMEHVPFGDTYAGTGAHWLGERVGTNIDTSSLQCYGSPSAPWLANAQWLHAAGKYHGCVLMLPTAGFGDGYTPSDTPAGGADVLFYNDACSWFEEIAKTACLCATSSRDVAAATSETLPLVTAQHNEMVGDATTWASAMFVLMAVLLLLPLLCIYVRARSLRSARDANGEAGSDLDTKAVLRDASSSAAMVRMRVSGVLVFLGWALVVVALLPSLFQTMANLVLGEYGLRPAIGSIPNQEPLPWGLCLMLLAILPTDISAIRCMPFVFLALFAFLFLNFAGSAWSTIEMAAFTDPVQFWFITIAWTVQLILVTILFCILLPTIRCCHGCCWCSSHRMTPRAALNRMWLALRCELIGAGVPPAAYVISTSFSPTLRSSALGALVTYAASFILAGAAFTPANRGRIRRFLGSFGAKGSSEQEAAAIAALIGRRSPAVALSLAASKFRMLMTDQLEASDLAASKDTGMFTRTKQVALGECNAFLSHSWQDDGMAKYAALSAWSERQKSDERSIWLDKACIDQNANIDDQLVALPIFLSGCKQLLIIAGPTYTSRLWCTMEVFTFVRMNGGQHQSIVVEPIAGITLETLSKFDGGKSQCFDPKDRSHLLAVIESGMGDLRHFNLMVGAIFAAKAKGSVGLVALSKGAAKGKAAKKYQVAPEAEPPVPPAE